MGEQPYKQILTSVYHRLVLRFKNPLTTLTANISLRWTTTGTVLPSSKCCCSLSQEIWISPIMVKWSQTKKILNIINYCSINVFSGISKNKQRTKTARMYVFCLWCFLFVDGQCPGPGSGLIPVFLCSESVPPLHLACKAWESGAEAPERGGNEKSPERAALVWCLGQIFGPLAFA